MISYHPSATKAAGGKGFRALVLLRKGQGKDGRMVGAKTGLTVYATKDDARNAAREVSHNAVATLARDYPQFMARVA